MFEGLQDSLCPDKYFKYKVPKPYQYICHLFVCVYIFLVILQFKFIYLFLFLAALGLRCCARAFSNCGEQGLLFVVLRRLLVSVASLVEEHGL